MKQAILDHTATDYDPELACKLLTDCNALGYDLTALDEELPLMDAKTRRLCFGKPRPSVFTPRG